jgi:hypothetical protein
MTAPAIPLQPAGKEEVDLWWGSYAGRTLTPSFAVCLLLTVAIYAAVHELVPERGWTQLAFVVAAGIVWAVQLARWCHRFFTCNYRLTTRYLYVDSGIRPLVARRVALRSIDRLEVRCNRLGTWLDVGDVWAYVKDTPTLPVVLRGLHHPHKACELIRAAVCKTNEVLS